MNPEKPAIAGSLESSDVMVEVAPHPDGIELELDSIVFRQYGEEIKRVIRDELAKMGVANAKVKANDRGALECVIRARVETAVRRSRAEGGQ